MDGSPFTDARFSDDTLTKAITELSRRGQGKPNNPKVQDIPAEFMGDFRLQEANLGISKLQFVVPGVTAKMEGSYGLTSEQLNFVGDVRLAVPVSQTMTARNDLVLVPFDLSIPSLYEARIWNVFAP